MLGWSKVGPSLLVLDLPCLFSKMLRRSANFWPSCSTQAALPFLRPLLMVDGCHGSLARGSTIIQATGLDGENHIVPLAIAFGGSETKQTCHYLFQQMKKGM